MFCKKCGTQNDENAWKCIKCGDTLQQTAQQQPSVKVPNYLTQAIIVTILCCVPLGIPAIVFASQVNGKIGAGDIQGAMESSRKAKMWCWISFVTGLVIGIIYLLSIVLGMMSGSRF